jgi:hypothetical protein
MIAFAHFVYVAFMPSIVLGIGLGVVWRYVDIGRMRTTLQMLAALLFFVPQPCALYLGAYSAGLRAYQQGLLSLWGLSVGGVAFARLWSYRMASFRRLAIWRETPEEMRQTSQIITAISNRRSRHVPPKLVVGLVAIAMTALGFYSAWVTVGDYLLPHGTVAGTVEGARVIRNTRSPNTYEVTINHRPYNITFDLLSRISPGEYIEGDVGMATRTILAVRPPARGVR